LADRNGTAVPQDYEHQSAQNFAMTYVTDLDLRREALSLAIGWAVGNPTNTERLMRVAAEFFAFLKKGEQPDG